MRIRGFSIRHAFAPALVLSLAAVWGQAPVNPDAKVISDFEKRVAAYVKIHRDAQKKLPRKPTDDLNKIALQERKLAATIRKQRPHASAGDFFSPPVASEFRRLASLALNSQDAGAAILKSLQNAEPVKTRISVNQAWPRGLPLQSMPPSLLQNLPPLPPELDYRIVSRSLILRDVAGNLVLDILPGFLPPSGNAPGANPPARSAAGPPSAPGTGNTAATPEPAGKSNSPGLPAEPKSVKFAVIGDGGTGDKPQYEVAQQMVNWHQKFPFEFVVMLGDNIYGGRSPADLERKFDLPYKPLLDTGVKFYASLGNHDDPATETLYKPMNMGGKRYYRFSNGNADFFALDSDYMDPAQLSWIEGQLRDSHADWKICFFHHPLYSHAKFHGSDLDLRRQLEPLFQRYGVNLVLNGHEHVYERIRPVGGIQYFVLGSSGQLRLHDLKKDSDIVKGFDVDRAFMVMEIIGNDLKFQTISRSGEVVDRDTLSRSQTKPPAVKAATSQ